MHWQKLALILRCWFIHQCYCLQHFPLHLGCLGRFQHVSHIQTCVSYLPEAYCSTTARTRRPRAPRAPTLSRSPTKFLGTQPPNPTMRKSVAFPLVLRHPLVCINTYSCKNLNSPDCINHDAPTFTLHNTNVATQISRRPSAKLGRSSLIPTTCESPAFSLALLLTLLSLHASVRLRPPRTNPVHSDQHDRVLP